MKLTEFQLTALVLTALVLVFAFVGEGDYQDALDQEARVKAHAQAHATQVQP